MLSATSKLVSGESEDWSADFKADATEAADTVTPIGGHILKNAFSNEQ